MPPFPAHPYTRSMKQKGDSMTNQLRDGLEAIIETQVQQLGNSLRKEIEKETTALFLELQSNLQAELESQIIDVFGALKQESAFGLSASGTGNNASGALTRLASRTLTGLLNRERKSVSVSTRESARSTDEQSKFRTSRSQQLHDASVQLAGGEKNA